jgi:hypothetical protein
MKGDGISALAQVVVASFVIDRIVSGILFFAAFVRIIRDPEMIEEGPRRVSALKAYKFVYFVLAALLVIAVLYAFPTIRILDEMGIQPANPMLDLLVTGLLFVGGAERLSQFIQPPGGDKSAGKQEPPPPPLKIEGQLVLLPSEQADKSGPPRDYRLPSS